MLEPTEIGFPLAHASELEAIAQAETKTDSVDARLLARMLAAGLIPEVYPKPAEQREIVHLVRHRATLVAQRTELACRIHTVRGGRADPVRVIGAPGVGLQPALGGAQARGPLRLAADDPEDPGRARHGDPVRPLAPLEEQRAGEAIELTGEQVAFLEKQNPQFRERHVESSRPGELLCQDLFYVGRLKGVGMVYLNAVVDTYSSHAFGFLHVSKQAEAAVAVLHNDVLPFYDEREIEVTAILTDNGREYCGTDAQPYEVYLALNDIEDRQTKVGRPRTNGFVERFNRTVLDEFFRQAFREKLYESVAALQSDLEAWLAYYNTERSHLGYRTEGRRPIETINEYLESVREAA